MFIIYISHTPNNWWGDWIPGRFGFSDATEIFVFCSGMASAVAFGRSYDNRGWFLGTARVCFRVWQIYWAHIALFFFCVMMLASWDLYGDFEKNYINGLNLGRFLSDTAPLMVGLFTLTYVPNFFDILPMYMVLLLLMPLVMILSRVNLWLVAAFCLTLWILAQSRLLDALGLEILHISLPAEPWSAREWFFNPFAWQLVFFTGFAFMRGWLPVPPVSKTLVWVCIAFLVISAPFGSWKVFLWLDAAAPDLGDAIRQTWKVSGELRDKTEFAVLRYLHFLALAYLGWVAAGPKGVRLVATGTGHLAQTWRIMLRLITKVGQQSLAVFVFSMALARLIGFALDQAGRSPLSFAVANLTGFAIITCVAYGAGWFKTQPWKARKS